jgi:release factor glutamine methyltransferase
LFDESSIPVMDAQTTYPPRQSAEWTLSRRFLRRAIHFFSYHLFLSNRRTTTTRAAGFRLLVRPTVFHPRYFVTSAFFARFIGQLDLSGKRVADVGTGTGILALAAARAGAREVLAIDVNPNAVETAAENARANGLGECVTALHSDLLSAVAAHERFDVIISSPPSFPGEPRDLADRAWHAGPAYRDIAEIFDQARRYLAPDGHVRPALLGFRSGTVRPPDRPRRFSRPRRQGTLDLDRKPPHL